MVYANIALKLVKNTIFSGMLCPLSSLQNKAKNVYVMPKVLKRNFLK